MKNNLYLFGAFAREWAHNEQLFKILSHKYKLIDLTNRERGVIGFFGFIRYVYYHFNKAKNIPDSSVCFVGFNSFYDVLMLRLISVVYRKKIKIILEQLVTQYDTYIVNKPITKNFIKLQYIKTFLYFLDYLTLQSANVIIFDTNANLDRFSSFYRINKKKCVVIYLCANNEIFKNNKNENFWHSDVLNILWYGNPSKLHNLDFILEVFDKLDSNKFKCTLLDDMSEISLPQIENLLNNSHIALGCFGDTEKCTNVVINKEYESLATNTLLITKFGNKEFLMDCVIFCNTVAEVLEEINYYYDNRNEMKSIVGKANNLYQINCAFEKLLDEYDVAINRVYEYS